MGIIKTIGFIIIVVLSIIPAPEILFIVNLIAGIVNKNKKDVFDYGNNFEKAIIWLIISIIHIILSIWFWLAFTDWFNNIHWPTLG